MQWQKEFDEIILKSDLTTSFEKAEKMIEKCF